MANTIVIIHGTRGEAAAASFTKAYLNVPRAIAIRRFVEEETAQPTSDDELLFEDSFKMLIDEVGRIVLEPDAFRNRAVD